MLTNGHDRGSYSLTGQGMAVLSVMPLLRWSSGWQINRSTLVSQVIKCDISIRAGVFYNRSVLFLFPDSLKSVLRIRSFFFGSGSFLDMFLMFSKINNFIKNIFFKIKKPFLYTIQFLFIFKHFLFLFPQRLWYARKLVSTKIYIIGINLFQFFLKFY